MNPLGFLSIKDYVYIGLIVAMIGGAWYILDDWHYKPLRTQEKAIKELNEVKGIYEVEINNLNAKLLVCERNTTKERLEGLIEGVNNNENSPVIDYNNGAF